jgi:hypothetical protein
VHRLQSTRRFSVIAADGLDGESTVKSHTESQLLSRKAVAAGNSAILHVQKRVWSSEHAHVARLGADREYKNSRRR